MSAHGGEDSFDARSMDFDQLMFHAARYGNTEEKREHKRLAKEELMGRGGEALRYLVGRCSIENLWFPTYAAELVSRLDKSVAVPVLLDLLGSEEQDVRRLAAFFLGFYDVPEHADRILPLLRDEELCGAGVRTLGKWKVRKAVLEITPFLQNAKERLRVLAANALRDIGDPLAAPYLAEALKDPYFTVRCAAARALVKLGPDAEPTLLTLLPSARVPARRQIIRVLGELRSQRSVGPLRKLLADEDPGARGDAARALREIDPQRSDKWLSDLASDPDAFVRASAGTGQP